MSLTMLFNFFSYKLQDFTRDIIISYKAIKLETKDIVCFKHGSHTFLNCNKLKQCFKIVCRFILSNEIVISASYSTRSYTVRTLSYVFVFYTHEYFNSQVMQNHNKNYVREVRSQQKRVKCKRRSEYKPSISERWNPCYASSMSFDPA